MTSPNPNRLKRFLANLALICFGLFVVLGLLEAALRILSPSDVPWQRHEILGHAHVPGKEGVYREKGLSTPFRFNSQGWRDREYPLEKPKGAFRILVLGDSFTEGLQLPVEETFTERLEEKLNRDQNRPIEVINTGVGAFSTDQQYLALKHYGVPYKPDLIILAFCVENDIYGNLLELRGEHHKPYFFIDESGRLVQKKFELPKYENIKNFLRNHLQLYMFLRKRISKMNQLASLLMRLGLVRDTAGIQRNEHGVFIDYATHLARYSPSWEKAWEVTKALLLSIRDEAHRLNAGFLLVLINYDVLVHNDLWQEALATYPSMREGEWDLGKANRLLVEFCKINDIEVLDLLPNFQEEAARSGERLYIPVEGHWNRRGHELAAELIYENVMDTGSISSGGAKAVSNPTGN